MTNPPEAIQNHDNEKQRNKTLIGLTIGILVLALLWLCYWFFYLRFHEYTDDAYGNGSMVNINVAVPGSVVAFYADDTDLVVEGQLLVQLDRTDYLVTYERELATLAATVLQVRQLYDTVATNRANVENKRTALSRAMYDFENRSKLVDSLAVSDEDFVHAKKDFLLRQTELKQAEAELQTALDAAGNTPMDRHPLIEQQKTRVRTAYYNLSHTSIYSPVTGFVAQRAVQVGQWATPNQNLMAVIPKDYVWVDANFKETQLTHMRIGQPATVWLDIYGSGVEYKGKVLGIASGTGSVFSIIPPQNATGNWIKIVQRLPVRIGLDAEQINKFPIRLGLSAEVDVDISDTTLPMLAQTPPTKPVTTTRIFDISFEKVDETIAQIIADNLKEGTK